MRVRRVCCLTNSEMMPLCLGDVILLKEKGDREGNRQEGQGSPNGGNGLHAPDAFSLLSGGRRQTASVRSWAPLGLSWRRIPCEAGGPGSIPGLGRSSGEGKGCPLQDSGLENPMDYTVHGVTKNWTRLSDFKHKCKI